MMACNLQEINILISGWYQLSGLETALCDSFPSRPCGQPHI
jgi:hypothetical protein